VGVSCGIVVTLLLGRLVASMLYDTSPSNPWVLAGASTVLLVTGAIATLVPALRATRADPVAALRAD
ncbi:MAG: hypothetical protein ABJF01_25910, partial [bacterium]